MIYKRKSTEINAGSMADIAFLLLIFFLVTTTMDVDAGIARKLPPIEDLPSPTNVIHKKNIFSVLVNANNDLLVEDEYLELEDLRAKAKIFINNNGDASCDYCQGAQGSPQSSDNPHKAVISLQNDRSTSYQVYVAVQNELAAAYNELRNELAQRRYGVDFKNLDPEAKREVKAAYPLIISEAEPVSL